MKNCCYIFLIACSLSACNQNQLKKEQALIDCLRTNTILLEKDAENNNNFYIFKLESNQSKYKESIYRNRYAIQKNLLNHYKSLKMKSDNSAAIDSLWQANSKSHLLGIDIDFKIKKAPANDSLSFYLLKNLYLQGIIDLQTQLIQTLPNEPFKLN